MGRIGDRTLRMKSQMTSLRWGKTCGNSHSVVRANEPRFQIRGTSNKAAVGTSGNSFQILQVSRIFLPPNEFILYKDIDTIRNDTIS